MPQTTLYDRTGKSVGSVELADALFAAPVNAAVLHQVVTAQLAGRRTGTHDTKTRGEVRGGGRKPYRQKGTGRARQGSRTAPHYRGGGAVFGPHPRSLRAAPAAQDEAAGPARRAHREARRRRDQGDRRVRARGHQDRASSPASCVALEAHGRVLVVAPGRDQTLELSARNLPTVEVILADSLNVVDLLKADVVLIEQPALARMEEVYA